MIYAYLLSNICPLKKQLPLLHNFHVLKMQLQLMQLMQTLPFVFHNNNNIKGALKSH